MAALSVKAKVRIDGVFGSKKDSLAFQASVSARSALTAKQKAALIVALASNKKISAEIVAATASGAALTKEAKRVCLIAMGGEVAGNELINFIQSVATKAIKL